MSKADQFGFFEILRHHENDLIQHARDNGIKSIKIEIDIHAVFSVFVVHIIK